ncbi:MAG: hypothetical protein KBS81_03720, partial [Spirochaetales bacterium]|nr:hypothetical protein [Candidatus Physcosoma equi]
MKRRGLLLLTVLSSPSLLFAGDGTAMLHPFSVLLLVLLFASILFILYLQKKLKALKEKNEEQRYYMVQRMKIARSMSNIYHTSFYVSLIRDSFLDFSVKGDDGEPIDTPGSARKMLQDYAFSHAGSGHLGKLKDFLDLDALQEKANPSNLHLLTYKDINNRWNQVALIVGDRDEKGNICHVFVGIRDIDAETKRREAEEYQMDEEVSLIEGLSTDYREVWLLKSRDMSLSLFRSQFPSYINKVVNHGGFTNDYSEVIKRLVNHFVYRKDRQSVLEAAQYDRIAKATENGATYYIPFRQMLDGVLLYRQLVISKADTNYGDKNFVIAIRDVSEFYMKGRCRRESLEKPLPDDELP